MIGDCINCGSKDVELHLISVRELISKDRRQWCRYCLGNDYLTVNKKFEAYCFNALEKRLIDEIRLCANKKEGE